jgi:SAM-dependent methyltransferase
MTTELEQKRVVDEHFRDFSTSWGQRYDAPARKMSDLDMQLRRRNVQHLLRTLLAASPGPWRGLDLGCGAGKVLEGIPREGLSIVGVDLVPEMVAVAAGNHPEDRFAAADAAHLPFRPGSFDFVTSVGVLEYIPDPLKVLRGVHALLRPEGHLIMSLPNRVSLFRKLSQLEGACERAGGALVHWLRGRPAEADRPKYQHAQWSPREGARLFEEAGFLVDEVRFNTYGVWGRIGRTGASLWLSAFLSRHFSRRSPVSSLLAHTMVFRVKRP